MAHASNSSDAPCVLVVDDSPTMRRSVAMTLETAGYRVVVAEDGRAALALLRQGLRPQLLLTDIVMPNMDGLTLIREARQLVRFAPIVALTTQSHPEQRAQGKAAGATAWLLKPTGGRELVDLVGRFVSPRAVTAEARQPL
jgi:two-component system, chemotaxis family, chemotaxis protein CheY